MFFSSSCVFFQLRGKHGVDRQTVRVFLVDPRSCRRAPQDVRFPPASLSSATQHVQAVLCRNWTVRMPLTRLHTLNITVIS